jgi:hypothetical protein
MNDEICSKQELKQFAYSDFGTTAIEFDLWICEKTKGKYTVIEYELVREALSVTKHYADSKVLDAFNTKWEDSLIFHKL